MRFPITLMGYGLGEVVYDGFGNAVGWNPFDTIRDVVSGTVSTWRGARNVAQGVGKSSAQVRASESWQI